MVYNRQHTERYYNGTVVEWYPIFVDEGYTLFYFYSILN